jgi:hypothetical protein
MTCVIFFPMNLANGNNSLCAKNRRKSLTSWPTQEPSLSLHVVICTSSKLSVSTRMWYASISSECIFFPSLFFSLDNLNCVFLSTNLVFPTHPDFAVSIIAFGKNGYCWLAVRSNEILGGSKTSETGSCMSWGQTIALQCCTIPVHCSGVLHDTCTLVGRKRREGGAQMGTLIIFSA